MARPRQLSLFIAARDDATAAPLSIPSEATRRSTLAAAVAAFHPEMMRRGFTQHTVKAFSLDLKLLGRYLGAGRMIGSVSTRDLGNFLHYLRYERSVPCSPKSLERRLTTVKVFFQWLAQSRLIDSDPAAPLVHEPSIDPLPRILSDDQVEGLMETARRLMGGDPPDPRPYLLISLLLHTGIKKSECAGILLEHIDLSDSAAPVLWVRYGSPRYARKERRLSLPGDFVATLRAYRAQYRPQRKLFECTMRNLEYVLGHAGKDAGMSTGISFECLRMTAAVRDYRAGMPPETMRKKYGLSTITWNSETLPRIKRLAEAPI